MSKIISISLTHQEKQWLEDMELSPTALIKQKITEMQVSTLAQRNRIKGLEANIQLMQNRVALLYKFIEEKKLFEEFAIFEKNNHHVLDEKTDSIE